MTATDVIYTIVAGAMVCVPILGVIGFWIWWVDEMLKVKRGVEEDGRRWRERRAPRHSFNGL